MINPTNLARVIPVSNESVVPDFLPVAGAGKDFTGMKNLTQELDKWNVTWGLIIANSDVFFEVNPSLPFKRAHQESLWMKPVSLGKRKGDAILSFN